MMRSLSRMNRLLIAGLGAGLVPNSAMAFDSGSTGVDGAFSPTANTEVQLPPNGIFNFTTVNIPSGVTITFKKYATNTPVVILASGNVTIAGEININGGHATNVGAAGDGNLADDGLPGKGGPGGYDGGHGALAGYDKQAGSGLGPGGGAGGKAYYSNGWSVGGGGGGGFSTAGTNANGAPSLHPGSGGPAYGSSLLLPLIGGSGGGGGGGGSNFGGSGGGGGGGAILIASSTTVNVTGAIYAYGGNPGGTSGVGCGALGGAGSAGAIRVVATTITGNGTIAAPAGTFTVSPYCASFGGAGAPGRIRLEAEYFQRTTDTNPTYSLGKPDSVFVAGLPSLKITSIAGVTAPVAPTGNADITLPADTTNPVAVTFATTGVPLDSVITLSVKPARGTAITATSGALTGTQESATASISVSLPSGASTLTATTSYTVTVAVGDSLSMYAQGERVEKIELSASTQGSPVVTLITISGKRHTIASADVAAYLPG